MIKLQPTCFWEQKLYNAVLHTSVNTFLRQDNQQKYILDKTGFNILSSKAIPPEIKKSCKILIFNGTLDTFIFGSIAKEYGRFTNNYIKSRIGTFINNN